MVGPVLTSGTITMAVIEAIRNENSSVTVEDRGSYQRVLVPQRCTVSKQGIEAELGRPIRFPGELEMVMATYKGQLSMDESGAAWNG